MSVTVKLTHSAKVDSSRIVHAVLLPVDRVVARAAVAAQEAQTPVAPAIFWRVFAPVTCTPPLVLWRILRATLESVRTMCAALSRVERVVESAAVAVQVVLMNAALAMS